MKFLLPNIFMVLIITICTGSAVGAITKLPQYELSVSLEPKTGRISGTARITINNGIDTVVSMGKLKTLSSLFNGSPIEPKINDGTFTIDSEGTLEIMYEGLFFDGYEGNGLKDPAVLSRNIISAGGISLTDAWYPEIEGLAHYTLKATVPPDFTAVSEANHIIEREAEEGKEYEFLFPHPLDGIHLAANKFIVIKEDLGGIGIYGYFIGEDISIAQTYVNYAKKYIKMYEDLIDPYPYKRFAVVENNLPTGYSMPTFTLLGKDVVRLPFIVHSSLGHEVLHQWFGNSVFVEYKEGNWVEGLTTYLADHLYEEQKRKGWRYRKTAMINYQSYVTSGRQSPLRDFIQRTDFTSKVIGYDKCAMIFHMLKDVVGEDVFYNALRRLIHDKQFERTSWNDIRAVFEKASRTTLDWFFQQWLERKDVPRIEINDAKVIYKKGAPFISFEVAQKAGTSGEPYQFDLKVLITTDEGDATEVLKISKEVETFLQPVEGAPVEIIFDPDYDLMRELSVDEYPPVLSRLLGDEDGIVVLSNDDGNIYSSLTDLFETRGISLKSENEIKEQDIISSSLLILGENNAVHKRLFGVRGGADISDSSNNQMTKAQKAGFTLSIKKHPLNPSKVVAIANAKDADEVFQVARKLLHYGRYSSLKFDSGKNIEKSIVKTDRGIHVGLRHSVRGIKPSSAISLDEIIEDIIDKPIIYVGESHTSYEDHKVQLEVIRRLHVSGRKVAVGMEMFQRQFQKGLDDYLSGKTNEREFLKSTEYFKRWKFDYHLYKEIIDFAKSKNMPVVALNIESEITEKVARGGLDALSEEQRKKIPIDMDMSDEQYTLRLRKIFAQEGHELLNEGEFYDFYQAQVLWDETMAHTVHEFLSNAPDHQMVVLAGSGHVMYGSGIPKRVHRLNGKEFAILISANFQNIDETVADYVFFPSPLSPPTSPKLGIFIQDTEAGVKIDDFTPESIALKAGLKKGDIIVSIDDLKIETVEDLKISLFGMKPGENINVKVLRKKFLRRKKEKEFSITLQ